MEQMDTDGDGRLGSLYELHHKHLTQLVSSLSTPWMAGMQSTSTLYDLLHEL